MLPLKLQDSNFFGNSAINNSKGLLELALQSIKGQRMQKRLKINNSNSCTAAVPRRSGVRSQCALRSSGRDAGRPRALPAGRTSRTELPGCRGSGRAGPRRSAPQPGGFGHLPIPTPILEIRRGERIERRFVIVIIVSMNLIGSPNRCRVPLSSEHRTAVPWLPLPAARPLRAHRTEGGIPAAAAERSSAVRAEAASNRGPLGALLGIKCCVRGDVRWK